MAGNVEIREPDISQLPALEIVRRQAIEAGFSEVYDRNQFADLVAGPSEQLRGWLTSQTVTVLMVETNITPVSFGAGNPESGDILALYTAPEYQGEGCGTEVLRRLEETLKEASREIATLRAPRNAVSYFESRGYEPTGDKNKDPVETIRMNKRLTGPG